VPDVRDRFKRTRDTDFFELYVKFLSRTPFAGFLGLCPSSATTRPQMYDGRATAGSIDCIENLQDFEG
jgi:hypothetical protein